MSVVVLRCPNCGTTQAGAGECEACHEAAVRHFCPNHTPGLWLDGPACTACGATTTRDRLTSPAAPPPRRAEPLPPARPAPRAPRAEPPRPAALPPRADRPLRPPPARPARPTREERRAARASEPARRAERRPLPPTRERVPVEVLPDGELVVVAPRAPMGSTAPRVPRARLPFVGCLVRLVLLFVLLAVLAAGALFWLVGGGSVLDWVVDVGQSTGVIEGVPAQTERGIAAYEAGDRARAEQELREAAQLYPRSALALVYLGQLRLDEGDVERAGEYLRTAVAREPTSALAHRTLGAYYAARARRPRDADAGDAAAESDLLEAERQYRRALALAPAEARTVREFGCVLADLGRSDEAARVLAGVGGAAACGR